MNGEPVETTGSVRARQAVLNRASLQSAAGTIASRLTGLLRLVMIAYALGGGSIADAFNLANTTPNIVHDLVLGGVLGATFVPVFVERLAKSDRREAHESISAVVSLAIVVLLFTTVLFEFAVPGIMDLYTLHAGSAGSPAKYHLAVELLRLFAPQLLAYGALSIIGAVLATDDRFAAVGIAPVVNNVVGIVVLAVFASLNHSGSITALTHEPGKVWFLGVGTTLGVVLQAAVLVPSLRRSQVRLRFLWRPSDPAVRQVLKLSGWTFGFVAANQVAVFVVLALEYHLGPGRVSAYTYAYTFFQFPFGVAAAAIVNVATPDLARAWSARNPALMGRRFGTAIRQLLAVILPSMIAYLVLAQPAVALLIEHGHESGPDARLTASVLVLFALGLPGYCVYFLAVRTFQAMQDTRTACYCYLLENGLNIVAALLLYGSLGVQGLALSYTIAYTTAAVVALLVLRRRLGTIGGRMLAVSSSRSLALALLMAIVLALVTTIFGTGTGFSGWVKLAIAVGAGGATYLGAAGVAGTLARGSRSGRRTAHRRGAVDVAGRDRH